MSPRTILFLHTEAPTIRALARERPEGRLVLATDAVPAEATAVFDEVVELPPADAVAATLARLEEIPADEVVVQTEYGLLAGTLLARSRGLRGPEPRAALLTTDKWLQRETLRAAGVAVPRYALAETADDVRRFAGGRWPVVVKPVASTLGHLVTRVDSADAAAAAVAALRRALPESPHVRRCTEFARIAGLDMGCDATRQFLVEEFADGPPRETDGLVFGDRIDLFGVTEQVLSPPPHFFIEGYLFPVAAPAIEEVSLRALRALGVRDAGFSIEFRGEVLIEVNGRLGEDGGFPELFRAALGRYPVTKWLEGDATPAPRARAGHAIAYANWYRDGIVRSAPPSSADATVLAPEGTTLHAPPHVEMSPHLAYALRSHADGASAAYAAARDAVSRLRFEIEPLPCAS